MAGEFAARQLENNRKNGKRKKENTKKKTKDGLKNTIY